MNIKGKEGGNRGDIRASESHLIQMAFLAAKVTWILFDLDVVYILLEILLDLDVV
jgi:hypothetical protein